MLKVEQIDAYYDKVQALHSVSLEVGSDEIISIIGSNGAGKSTLMNTISGIVLAKKGRILFQDKDITNMKTHLITRLGIVQVPEGREIFPGMTVLENLEMGSYAIKRTRKEMQDKLDEMYELFPKLAQRRTQKAGSLSGGEQQMVAIARGLMAEPKLLMLDEPSLGLAPVIVEDVFRVIQKINHEKHIPILLVEQNAFMALEISNRCYILENGTTVMNAPSEELLQTDAVIKAYLGGGRSD